MDENQTQPDDGAISEFLATMGGTNTDPAPTTDPTPATTDPAPEQQDPTPAENDPVQPADQTQTPDPTTPETDPTQPAQPTAEEKSAKAFAAMRVENSNYKHMLTNMAQTIGIKETDPEKVMSLMQTKLNEMQAKQQGVSPEMYERLQRLEQSENQQRVASGFQQVKDQFNLSDADLQNFANSLVASGVNPFEKPIDLVTAYKLQNFDTMMEAAKQRGIQEEMERSTKASSQSTVPNQATGDPNPSEPDKINTFAQLDALFASNLKS